MVRHNLKIFKVCLAILGHYALNCSYPSELWKYEGDKNEVNFFRSNFPRIFSRLQRSSK